MKHSIKKVKKILIYIVCTLVLTASFGSVEGASRKAHALTEEDEAWYQEARAALAEIVDERPIMALVYLSDEYPVRVEPSYDSETILTVPSGQLVTIEDAVISEDHMAWEYVSLYYGDTEYCGYVPRTNLACSDERFLEWESSYGMNPMAAVPMMIAEGPTPYADINQFPASYQAALVELKNQYPSWIFVPMNTGLNWSTVINNEIGGGKSLIYKNQPDYTKEGLYDTGNWYYASRAILEYYMDPRNSLTLDSIFQFEQLTYNESYHTEAAVESFLNKTFMNSSQKAPGTVMTYAHIFWSIGAEEGRKVSPFHLAARVYQEQGQGDSPLISGNYPGYVGYYNYFNVGASGTTNEQVIVSGLQYAKDHGWDNAYHSILGGADVISANYIRKGQDTLYLQKFNVNPTGGYPLYTHQYMQNIMAPTTEGSSIMKLYQGASSLDNTFVFKIPVFNNMPGSASAKPTSSTNVVLQVPSGYDTTVYLDGMAYSAVSRNGRYIVTAPHANMTNAVVYRYDASGVPVGMYVWTLEYQNGAYKVTAQPQLTDLLTYHGFSIRITGKSGIRYKTGISADLRNQLTSSGVNGYTLKEYGTLVMNNANRSSYPMILGGEKVSSGMSYGVNANGALEDKIYETVGGRYRFTSVLVGLPASQYKVEYAFRGYAILEKNGVQTVVYGPVVARSIYALAEQVLNMGLYPSDSEADAFLRTLIRDAQ
ncbi:MAG: hypothetical protein J1E64_00175 [Acetatifactor sp.]|nr:hypothetical protein [Acetatifactor sp.]